MAQSSAPKNLSSLVRTYILKPPDTSAINSMHPLTMTMVQQIDSRPGMRSIAIQDEDVQQDDRFSQALWDQKQSDRDGQTMRFIRNAMTETFCALW